MVLSVWKWLFFFFRYINYGKVENACQFFHKLYFRGMMIPLSYTFFLICKKTPNCVKHRTLYFLSRNNSCPQFPNMKKHPPDQTQTSKFVFVVLRCREINYDPKYVIFPNIFNWRYPTLHESNRNKFACRVFFVETCWETIYMLKKTNFWLSSLVNPDRESKVSPTESS